MMVKEKTHFVSIFRNKFEMLITHKGFHFETSDKVFQVPCITTSQYDIHFFLLINTR